MVQLVTCGIMVVVHSILLEPLYYGLYTVSITDAVGCNITDTIIIGTLPVLGCTDPVACNYDANANTDDGFANELWMYRCYCI